MRYQWNMQLKAHNPLYLLYLSRPATCLLGDPKQTPGYTPYVANTIYLLNVRQIKVFTVSTIFP